MEDTTAPSPFDVDIGGHQRQELRAALRATSLELRAAREECGVLEAKWAELRTEYKTLQAAVRVEGHQRRMLLPVFHAWRRMIAAAVAQRSSDSAVATLERAASANAALADERAEQVAELTRRVARVKSNAQSKLGELSQANHKLMDVLKQRNAELRSVRQRASEDSQALTAEVLKARSLAERTLSELKAAERRVAQVESATLAHRAALDFERSAREEEAQSVQQAAATARAELCILHFALCHADSEIGAARAALLEQALQAERQQARLDGARAETDCLKAEATAQCSLGAISCDTFGCGEGAKKRFEMLPVGVLSTATRDAFHLRSFPLTAEAVELHRCRRALLSATFWAWADRVAFCQELRAERSRSSLVVALPRDWHNLSAAEDFSMAQGRAVSVDIDGLVAMQDASQSTASDLQEPNGCSLGDEQIADGGVVGLRRVLVGEVLKTTLDAKYAEIRAVWQERVAMGQVDGVLLKAAVAEAEAVATEALTAACNRSRALTVARAKLEAAEVRATTTAGDHVARCSVLRGQLSVAEAERAEQARRAEELQADIARGERMLMDIAAEWRGRTRS